MALAIALLGPILVGIAAVAVSSLGLELPVVPLALAALAALGAAIVVVARRRLLWGLLAALPTAGLALFLDGYRAAPLPAPPPLDATLPPATPPAGMALVHLPTGVTHRTAAFAYRGGSFSDRRDFAMSAVLVRHPRGDLLIDSGLSRDVDAQLAAMPLTFRLVTRIERGRSAAEQLAAAGYPPAQLAGILLTHAHWDHVSGARDLPDVPLWVTEDERRFIEGDAWVTAVARGLPAARYHVYPFDSGPYLGFPRSHDVYGDGAIVVVPAPGHTPGSVIIFVATPDGRRHAFVGDLVWQREGILEREERPWLTGRLADHQPAALRADLLRMAAIAQRFPEITIVPAHDARAFAALSR